MIKECKCKLEIAEKVLLTPKQTSFIVPVRFVNLPRVRFVISLSLESVN